MKPKIGVVIPRPAFERLFTQADRERLAGLGTVVQHQGDEKLSAEEATGLLQGCEIGLGSWGTPYPDAVVVAGCPDLRLWMHCAGSVKYMFGPHLEGRSLVIASCAPAIADAVAEITLGQLIVGLKQLLPHAAANHAGRAPKPSHSLTLGESTIGVIGASTVGRRVIALLQPFRPRILVYDPWLSEAEAATLGVTKQTDLPTLCAACDAVTLHTPAIPATRHIIGRPEFQAMPDHAVFVNTARGMCVDEQALGDELGKGRLFAFIDVSDPEPAADDSPLRRLPNIVYSSHIAGGPTPSIGRQAVDDVAAFLAGKQPAMAVTADMLERLA